MFQQYRPSTAFIDLQNLSHNVRSLRKLVNDKSFFCPVIKADAYGHGSVQVAKQLERDNMKNMAVALIEEAIVLRDNGIKANILFLGVFQTAAEARIIVDYKITPVISTWDQIAILEEILEKPLEVHVEFDTGMSRLGFEMSELDQVYEALKSHNKIKVVGVMTHFHTGEDAAVLTGATFGQLRVFQNVVETFKPLKIQSHTLNSAGTLIFAQHKAIQLPHGISSDQGARPGLSLYGVAPVMSQTPVELKSVMSLRTRTVKYHHLMPGQSVSYNGTWKANKESVIAAVPMGYADGYHRALSNKGEVLFRGQKAAVVGNVCMDYFMIDVTPFLKSETASSLKPEEVTLFGFDSKGVELPTANVAKNANTIAWEILTSVSARVPRVYTDGGLK